MADLEIKGLSKSFSGIHALSNVDFFANSGEVHALLGENGAGKSTLIKCLGACQSCDTGEIFLEGKKLTATNPKEAMDAGIGIVFQELSLVPSLSVADNLFLGMRLENRLSVTRRKLAREKALAIFQEYGIHDIDPDQQVDSLTLSEKQMIEIVKVISRNTKVVVFDEATSALSANRVEWLLQLVRRLQGEQRIIIFISHRMGEIRTFCNMVTVFRNGQNVGSFALDEVDNDQLVTLMLGRKVVGYYPEKINTRQEKVSLEAKDLYFENFLEHIDFHLHYGEVVGIGGLAGQGQNALMMSLAGCVKLQHGMILLDGRKLRITGPSSTMDAGIVLLPEERATEGLVLDLSIADNLLLPAISKVTKFGFIQRKKTEKLLSHAVQSLSIKAPDLDAPVKSLSGGNQQKVVLAKLMMLEPKVLLLFDFTRGVDVGTKNTMFTLVRQLAANGNSILFYSTDIEELVNVCDRVLVMDNGAIKAEIGEEKLTRENVLRAAVGEQVR